MSKIMYRDHEDDGGDWIPGVRQFVMKAPNGHLLAPGERYIQCPYDLHHITTNWKCLMHFTKCRKRYLATLKDESEAKVHICAFDAAHHVQDEHYYGHLLRCPKRTDAGHFKKMLKEYTSSNTSPLSGFGKIDDSVYPAPTKRQAPESGSGSHDWTDKTTTASSRVGTSDVRTSSASLNKSTPGSSASRRQRRDTSSGSHDWTEKANSMTRRIGCDLGTSTDKTNKATTGSSASQRQGAAASISSVWTEKNTFSSPGFTPSTESLNKSTSGSIVSPDKGQDSQGTASGSAGWTENTASMSAQLGSSEYEEHQLPSAGESFNTSTTGSFSTPPINFDLFSNSKLPPSFLNSFGFKYPISNTTYKDAPQCWNFGRITSPASPTTIPTVTSGSTSIFSDEESEAEDTNTNNDNGNSSDDDVYATPAASITSSILDLSLTLLSSGNNGTGTDNTGPNTSLSSTGKN